MVARNRPWLVIAQSPHVRTEQMDAARGVQTERSSTTKQTERASIGGEKHRTWACGLNGYPFDAQPARPRANITWIMHAHVPID